MNISEGVRKYLKWVGWTASTLAAVVAVAAYSSEYHKKFAENSDINLLQQEILGAQIFQIQEDIIELEERQIDLVAEGSDLTATDKKKLNRLVKRFHELEKRQLASTVGKTDEVE